MRQFCQIRSRLNHLNIFMKLFCTAWVVENGMTIHIILSGTIRLSTICLIAPFLKINCQNHVWKTGSSTLSPLRLQGRRLDSFAPPNLQKGRTGNYWPRAVVPSHRVFPSSLTSFTNNHLTARNRRHSRWERLFGKNKTQANENK